MVSWCGVAVFLGTMYMLAMVMSLKCFVCIFRSCVVRVDGLWRLDVQTAAHDDKHLFVCPAHPTKLIPADLWSRPTDAVRELSYLEARDPD